MASKYNFGSGMELCHVSCGSSSLSPSQLEREATQTQRTAALGGSLLSLEGKPRSPLNELASTRTGGTAMEGGVGDILALSELITGCQQAFEDEEESNAAQQRHVPALTPSTIGGAAQAPTGCVSSNGGRMTRLPRLLG